MASTVISQVTIGSNTYDICDATARNTLSTMNTDLTGLHATVQKLTFKIVILKNHSDFKANARSTTTHWGSEQSINFNVVNDGGTWRYTHLVSSLSGFNMFGCMGLNLPSTCVLCSFTNYHDSSDNDWEVHAAVRSLNASEHTYSAHTLEARSLWIKNTSANIQVG